MSACAILAICACVLCLASPARADDTSLARPASEDAREHLRRGNRLYNIRSFEEAIAEYKAGALAEAAPVFDYNLGQCYRQLGRYEDAIWHYTRFLRRGQPEGQLRAAVEGFLQQMQSELDQKAMTQPPTEPAPEPPDAPAPADRAQVPEVDVAASQRALAEPAAWYDDHLGWGLLGAGAIGAGLAGGLLWNAAGLYDRANETSSQLERGRLRDQASTRTVLGATLGGVGLGLLVTGAIKLAIAPSRAPARPPTADRGSIDIGVTPGGFLVVGTF